MKNSAIVRIVIWGIVVLCLTALLLSGLGLGINRTQVATHTQNIIVNDTTATNPPSSAQTLVLSRSGEVFTSPSTESGTSLAELEAGTELSVTRRENIAGQQWAYITTPVQGWILTENLEPAQGSVSEAVSQTDPMSPSVYGSSMLAETISSISIDWLSGNILILAGDGDRISIEEPESNQPFVWKEKDGKLSIDFCEDSARGGLRLGGVKEKDLTITVPKDWVCQDLEIDAASSNLEFENLTIQKIEIDTANGQTHFTNCTVGDLEVDTAAGDVNFIGSLDSAEIDAASAHFIATLSNTPRYISMDSASGSLDLTLPKETSFSVRMEGLKNIFSSDYSTRMQNGAYVHGSGDCRIELESMSGGVYIRKGQ